MHPAVLGQLRALTETAEVLLRAVRILSDAVGLDMTRRRVDEQYDRLFHGGDPETFLSSPHTEDEIPIGGTD